MTSFLLDELKNVILYVINYINNDTIRNFWFIYLDYFDINDSNVSIMSLIYLISFIAIPILFIIVIFVTTLRLIY